MWVHVETSILHSLSPPSGGGKSHIDLKERGALSEAGSPSERAKAGASWKGVRRLGFSPDEGVVRAMSGLRSRPLGGRADAEVAADAGAWCAPAPRAYLLGLGADFAMARLAVTGDFGHERAERGTTATQPSRGSAVCQVCPHLRGKLDPPTFDLFC